MSIQLPRIYSCTEAVNMVDFIDVNFNVLGLYKIPAVVASTSADVNIYISDKTTQTARINFSQKFVGHVYYIVTGFN